MAVANGRPEDSGFAVRGPGGVPAGAIPRRLPRQNVNVGSCDGQQVATRQTGSCANGAGIRPVPVMTARSAP